jgi:hypothetical protein
MERTEGGGDAMIGENLHSTLPAAFHSLTEHNSSHSLMNGRVDTFLPVSLFTPPSLDRSSDINILTRSSIASIFSIHSRYLMYFSLGLLSLLL